MSATVVSCVLSLGCAAAGYTEYPGVAAFSEGILFSASILGARSEYAYGRMKDVIAEIDAEVSPTRSDSDIYRFNALDADIEFEVGAHAYALFTVSLELYEATDGAFNVASAPLTELWGVDALSLCAPTGARPLPTFEDVETVRAYCDPRSVAAYTRGNKFYLKKSDGRTKLDFGGIAKGYAVDRCVEILDEYDISSALIDISGNAYFYGRYFDNGDKSDWHVGVVSPRPRGGARGYVCAVSLEGDVSAVTSGDYMRYRTFGSGERTLYIPHIIAPNGVPAGIEHRDGQWAAADDHVISATVIGGSSAECDAYSTAVAALGMDKGSALLREKGLKGLIFSEKRFTIIGDVSLYDPDTYDGYRSYVYDGA